MLTLNPLFQDHAVFQQKMPIPVWGKAEPGHRLKTDLSGITAFTRVAASGSFKLRLPPMTAGGPFVFTITDLDSGEQITFQDVMVGEVWLASGQSNMEYPLSGKGFSHVEYSSLPFSSSRQHQSGKCFRRQNQPAQRQQNL